MVQDFEMTPGAMGAGNSERGNSERGNLPLEIQKKEEKLKILGCYPTSIHVGPVEVRK